VNLYAYAGNNPISFSDPFGLCPPKDIDVSTCGNSTLDNAWRALDGAGSAGRAVIQGVVSAGMSVAIGSAEQACGSSHGCSGWGGEGNRHWAITVEERDDAGTTAVTIAHEFGHSQQTGATTAREHAGNEANAYDRSKKVFDGLQEPYRKQAAASYGNAFRVLTPGSRTRMEQLRLWELKAIKEGWPEK
jgi:hypothetical protein